MKTTAGAIALLAILSISPSRAATPLQPTGKWTVDFGDAHCVAMRDYGTAQAPLLLAFKPSPIGDVMQVSVVRAGSNKETNEYPGMMSVGAGAGLKVSLLGYPAKTGKTRVNSVNLPLASYGRVRTASMIHLKSFGEIDQAFALSQMETVARTLDECVAGLRKVWHIAEEPPQIRRFPEPKSPLKNYFDPADYPRVALRGNASGVVEMVTLVDEAGKVASCLVTETSGYASLDAQSCSIMVVRAKFNPAMGMDGKPAKSGIVQRIRWKASN